MTKCAHRNGAQAVVVPSPHVGRGASDGRQNDLQRPHPEGDSPAPVRRTDADQIGQDISIEKMRCADRSIFRERFPILAVDEHGAGLPPRHGKPEAHPMVSLANENPRPALAACAATPSWRSPARLEPAQSAALV
jgi:hypothetical protein